MNVEYFSDDCIFPGPGLLMSEERIIRAMVTRVIMQRQCDNTWTPGGWDTGLVTLRQTRGSYGLSGHNPGGHKLKTYVFRRRGRVSGTVR